MEGLRGLAVFLVFLVHYVTLSEPWLVPHSVTADVAGALRRIGNSGVDLFFVLSGYLIYGTLIGRPQPFGRYFGRRVRRIYPAFLAVFGIYLLLSWVRPGSSRLPDAGLDALGYIVANVLLLPGMFPIEPLVTVAWSLSYEMFYYLIVPVLISVLGLRHWKGNSRILFFGVVAVAGFAAFALFGTTHIRLLMFVSGILLYEMLDRPSTPRLDLGGITALVLGLALTEIGAEGPLRFMTLFIAFFLLCFACFRQGSQAARLLSWTPLRWLGNMSYSYYLIHGLALRVMFDVIARVFPPDHAQGLLFWVGLPVLFASTLPVAATLFAVVEKPISLQRPSTVR